MTSMPRAAIPEYASRHGFDSCPPGHRFNLYFPVWDDQWKIPKDGARADALRQTLNLGSAAPALNAVLKRQQALAESLSPDRCLIVEAESRSPFSTGLGLEHPIENGFAFLSPYGLPYLAGSGVKGVLRRAAEELQADGRPGYDSATIDALFGPENTDAARRGALSCWDVFPVPQNGTMSVEIMTPHYSHYYQPEKGKEAYATPHDSGKPNPIAFLALPPGSRLRFIVACEPALLREMPQDAWADRVRDILEHAFDWLGFGAKTAVGYGALRRLSTDEVEKERAKFEASALRCEWVDATIRELAAKNRAPEDETLRGKALAEAWAALTDQPLRNRALADIRARWQAMGWWDSPPGGSSKKAKQIYESGNS